ncbi:MAG: glycosyltransferase family 2 protein [Hyphomicrobium sp.]
MIDVLVIAIHAAIAGVAVMLAAMSCVLLVEVLASFLPSRSRDAHIPATCRIAIVMPAHDEASGIEATIHRVLEKTPPDSRLVVVADNCTDNTGELAEKCGAEVVYRNDPSRRGKGYALDFAMRHLAAAPPDVVIILDADCIPEGDSLRTLTDACRRSNRPVQALYDLEFPAGARSSYLKLATFAWRLKNRLRPLGLRNLGLPCQLMGTGMAFPWGVLARVDLRTGHLVEDLVLGLELAAAGSAPTFEPEARVLSWFPPSAEGQSTQRRRWETGHLAVVREIAPKCFARGLVTGNRDLVALAVDAAVPPVAFLALASAATALAAVALRLATGQSAALWFALAGLGALLCAVLLAWRRVGRDILTVSDVVLVPGYIIRKIGIYAKTFAAQRLDWVRSKRD